MAREHPASKASGGVYGAYRCGVPGTFPGLTLALRKSARNVKGFTKCSDCIDLHVAIASDKSCGCTRGKKIVDLTQV